MVYVSIGLKIGVSSDFTIHLNDKGAQLPHMAGPLFWVDIGGSPGCDLFTSVVA